MADIDYWKAIACIATVAVVGATAGADATSSLPDQFKSDVYVEADYEDFCTSQSSGRDCIDVTIRNESRSKADLKTKDKDGSVLGSGALDGFQVFEFPGCVLRDDLPGGLRQHISSDAAFTRRMREEKLHYWKSDVEKTIKVLHGCSYAVAVKREANHHNWHFSYIPSSARTGCTLKYKYITKKADFDEYEKIALFGLLGGDAITLTEMVGLGGMTTASETLTALSLGAGSFEAAFSAGTSAGLTAATTAGVYMIGAIAAFEAGVWGVFGGVELVDIIDGKRVFTLNEKC